MPRRQKPSGYEKWTWAEIDTGRKFSKTEKRWNRAAKNMGWSQRANGTYEAPAEAKPLLAIMLILMLGLAVVAPNGLANAKGDAGAIGGLLFLAIIVIVLFVALLSSISSGSISSRDNTLPKSPDDSRFQPGFLHNPPRQPVLIPMLQRIARAVGYALSCKWVAALPEWAQPICWGVGIAVPMIGGFFVLKTVFGTSPRP